MDVGHSWECFILYSFFCKIKEHRFNSYALQCRKLFSFCDYHGVHMTSFVHCNIEVLAFTVFDRFSLYCYQYTGQNLSVMAMLQFKLSCASGFAAKARIKKEPSSIDDSIECSLLLSMIFILPPSF